MGKPVSYTHLDVYKRQGHYGRKMNNSRIKNIVNLSAAERYGYFIRKVSDFEEVWGLKERHTRRLRLGHLDGFDHRRHVCRRLFPRRAAGNRRFGSGQGVGLGPHSRQLPALLPGDQPHPLVHHHLRWFRRYS